MQYTLVLFDEATHFTWEQIEYLMSRLRSNSKYPSRMVMSCNPDPSSFLLPLVSWYLDEEGYPDPAKDGVIRYFIRRNGEFIWRDSKEEIFEEYGNGPSILPISFTFISANIKDNPPMLESNPEYLAMLEGLNEVDKARLLYGNWFARPTEVGFFKREWIKSVERAPTDCKWVRAWDKAATEPHDGNRHPDFTACMKMGKDKRGNYYIVGDFAEDNMDEKTQVYGHFRKRPGTRDNIILSQCFVDGRDCEVIMPVDPGAAGATEYQESAKRLIEHGYRVRKDPVPNNKSKVARFSPFSSACENGLVYVVESSFQKKTLEAYYGELESFTGDNKSKTIKDDFVDATSSAFNYLCRQQVIPDFSLAAWTSNDTPLSTIRETLRGN